MRLELLLWHLIVFYDYYSLFNRSFHWLLVHRKIYSLNRCHIGAIWWTQFLFIKATMNLYDARKLFHQTIFTLDLVPWSTNRKIMQILFYILCFVWTCNLLLPASRFGQKKKFIWNFRWIEFEHGFTFSNSECFPKRKMNKRTTFNGSTLYVFNWIHLMAQVDTIDCFSFRLFVTVDTSMGFFSRFSICLHLNFIFHRWLQDFP